MGRSGVMTGRDVWMERIPLQSPFGSGSEVQSEVWHLAGDTQGRTLCGVPTHRLSLVSEPWESVGHRCGRCEALTARPLST